MAPQFHHFTVSLLSVSHPSKFNEWLDDMKRPKVSYTEQMGAHILHTALDQGVCDQTNKIRHYDYNVIIKQYFI